MSSGVTRTKEFKANDSNLATYRRARKEGSQPRSSYLGEQALREADKLGRAFRADNLGATYDPEFHKELKSWEATGKVARPPEVQQAIEEAANKGLVSAELAEKGA